MEVSDKAFYEAPSTLIFEVRHEGIICASGGDYPVWTGEDI